MNKIIRTAALAVSLALLLAAVAGCAPKPDGQMLIHDPADTTTAAPEDGSIDIASEMVPMTQSPAMFVMPMPAATGTDVVSNSMAEVDISNTKDGYVMVKYLKSTGKALRVIVKGPSGTPYTYTLKADGQYTVLPLSDGNGAYQIGIYENVSGDKYSTSLSATANVKLADEFAPFLRPNQYVNYNSGSKTIAKAAELMKDSKNVTDKIAAVYHYVINNITYDKELAATVKSGYLPDVDKVLSNGKGICFDYAAVMTAMLRGQGVPTKLVVGYTGQIYHAWISTYSEETGWVDGIIFFDGKSWQLMDPTFASNGKNNSEVAQYIGDGKNYSAKYLY